MDFGDDEDQLAIADAIRSLCARFDDDYWSACDQKHEFPWDFYRVMADGGWLGIAMPEEYGGGGRGITEAATVLKEVAASGAAMNGCSALHLTIFGLNPVARFGSDRLKSEFLPRAAAGRTACGIRGHRTGRRHRHVAGARLAPSPTAGAVMWYGAEKSGPAKRWKARWSCFWSAPEARASAACRSCWPTWTVVTSTSGPFRRWDATRWRPARWPMTASRSRAGDGSERRARGGNTFCTASIPSGSSWPPSRSASGKRPCAGRWNTPSSARSSAGPSAPIRRSPIPSPRPASNWRRPGKWPGTPRGDTTRASIAAEAANSAKYLAAEAGFFSADRAVQTLGGMGYASEYHVERYFREARLQRIAPVSQEMTLNYVAQKVLGLPRSY